LEDRDDAALCLLFPVALLIDLILAGVGTGGLELTEKVGKALRKVWRSPERD
jgi:hypothetical protein